MLNTKCLRNRRRDKRIGRGNDAAQVPRVEMTAEQCKGFRADGRFDHRLHEGRMPGVQLLSRMTGERRERQAQIRVHVERASYVLLVVRINFLRMVRTAFETKCGVETCPRLIAIQRQQRVVQIEQRQSTTHPYSPLVPVKSALEHCPAHVAQPDSIVSLNTQNYNKAKLCNSFAWHHGTNRSTVGTNNGRSLMLILLNILSGVALLVWGTHIVRTGILRVFVFSFRPRRHATRGLL